MTSRERRKQWAAELPIETIEAIQEEKERTGLPMWEVVDNSLRRSLGVDDDTVASLKRQIEDLGEEKRRCRNLIEETQKELEQINERLARAEEHLEEVVSQQQGYVEYLDSVLEEMQSNPETIVYAYRGLLEDAAIREYGSNAAGAVESVVEDLKARRTDLGLPVPDSRFVSTLSKRGAIADGGKELQLRSLTNSMEDNR